MAYHRPNAPILMKISCCQTFVTLLLLLDRVDGFQSSHCLLPSFVASRPSVKLQETAERAGNSGYSVLRQPVTWNPDKDPEFDAPTLLQDTDNTPGAALDETWFKERTTKKTLQEAKKNQSPVPKHEELDLFERTLDTLDFPLVLTALENECTTVPGRDVVSTRQGLIPTKVKTKRKHPNSRAFMSLTADSVEGSKERYRAVEEMKVLMGGLSTDILQDAYWRNSKGYKTSLGLPPFQGMSFNMKSIFEMVDSGQVLEGPEILEVSTILDTLEEVTLWSKGLTKVDVEEAKFDELPKLCDCITVNATLQTLLHNAFDKTGRLSGTTFPKIGKLRAKVRTLKRDILSTLDTLIMAPSLKSKLALDSGGSIYSEINGRIVIPIDESVNNKASVGIVHDASRSGKTVYVEPTEIVSPTNELRQAEGELRTEEARVWRSLTEEVLLNRNDLEESVASIGQVDLTMARVLLGKKLQGVIPMVGNEGIVSLKNAKHPVLLLRQLENVVGSDIDVGADGNQGLVLTGPNSGGKTVILKLLGLVALMARTGIPIPAQTQNGQLPRVDFFNPVLADIGDLQSVDGDLSTFSGHMLVCREVLANAGKNALVLMDELGSGTDPAQGVAIAQALLEALVETGARVAITTHYLELKQLAASDERFAVGAMQFVNGQPTYKLLPGTVGESFALAVAERLSLPQSVINRANELLDQETRQMGDLIRELEDQKALIDQRVEELAQQKRDMAALELQMKTQQSKLESKQLGARRDEAKKFAKRLEEKEQVLEDVLNKLKSNPSRKIVAKSWDDIRFVKRDALNDAENVPSVLAQKRQAAEEQSKTASQLVPLAEMREKPRLQIGDKLTVCKQGPFFGQEAVILQAGKRLQVQISGMPIQMKMSELALPIKGMAVPVDKSSGKRGQQGPKNLSKASEKAIREEKQSNPSGPSKETTKSLKSTITFRTESNTVDVRGCYMEEAKSKCLEKFSKSLMSGRNVVYILHGHGTTGILKTKIRNWLKQERKLVKSFKAADREDGGDAFTMVRL